MSGAPSPPALLEPIASTAPSGVDPGDKTNPLPDSPTGTNAASVQGGFPAITMESELAGGLPPLGQDMNGFLFLLSSHTMYVECGQLYQFNSSLATAIGGYKVGTILGMSDGTGVWLNTLDGNTSNPDAGGAGWAPLMGYGVTVVPVSGGAVNLTAAQARYPVIALTGALTSNLTINLPNRLGTWLIANGTSGAFTTIAKTASGSTGVTIPQGGYASPTGVYCVGDSSIYPTVSPLAVPIDQGPTPLTLVERTNAGYILATYFNQDSGVENPTIENVFVDDGDGYHRKISLSNFGLQIFVSPNLTGTPSATTPPLNDSSARIATTAFANPQADPPNGHAMMPSGFVVQGGHAHVAGTTTIGFPQPFIHACIAFVLLNNNSTNQIYLQSKTTSGATVTNGNADVDWIAVGY